MTANNPMLKVQSASEDNEIDMMAMLASILEKWLFIAVVTLIFLILGIINASLKTPIYSANAIIQVEQKSSAFPGMSDAAGLFSQESNSITEIELIKSRSVIGVAVEREQLDISVTPIYFPHIGEALARAGHPVTMGSYASGNEVAVVTSFKVPAEFLGKPFLMESSGNGGFLLLNQDGTTILAGRQGELVERGGFSIFVQELVADTGVQFTVVKHRLLNAILRYQGALGVSERGKSSGIIQLTLSDPSPRQAVNILNEIANAYILQNVERQSAEAAKSLEFLHGQLPEVRKNLVAAEDRLNQYQVEAGSVDISVETQALLDQVVSIEADIAQLKLQKAELDRKYTEDHPNYVAWQEQVSELTQRKNELNEKVQDLPYTQQQLLGLRRDLEVSTAIYTQMLNNIQELDIARAGVVGNVRLIDEAVASSYPVSPNKKTIVAFFFMMGLFSAVAVVLIKRALHNGVETPEELESIGLPVYATVPMSEGQAKLDMLQSSTAKKDDSSVNVDAKLLAEHDPTDVSIESLRSLRTSLHFAMLETKSNAIMITGASPGVGKSFVAANLAAVIANSGKHVLLIDADLRKGYLHSMLNIDNSLGLSDVLSKQAPLSGAIRRTEIGTLYLMPRGSAPPNPSELLMSEFFNDCMDRVKDKFDFVIIDTPPILAVTDANIIGQQAGVTFMVVRFGVNSLKEVELSCKRFLQANVPVKGAILNAVERKTAGYGYGYGYKNYNYSYEYKADKPK